VMEGGEGGAGGSSTKHKQSVQCLFLSLRLDQPSEESFLLSGWSLSAVFSSSDIGRCLCKFWWIV
jgi:hypothetical protein